MDKKRKQPVRRREIFFDEKRDSLRSTLSRLFRAEKERHPSLLAIFEIPAEESQDGEALFEKYGITGYRQRFIKVENREAYSSHGKGLGGYVMFAQRGEEAPRTICFIRKPKGIDPETYSAYSIGAFMHEMGHVEDFEKGGLKLDTICDPVKFEYFAHAYAINEMFAKGLRFPAYLFIKTLKMACSAEVPESIRKAAELVLMQPELAEIVEAFDKTKRPSPEISVGVAAVILDSTVELRLSETQVGEMAALPTLQTLHPDVQQPSPQSIRCQPKETNQTTAPLI